MNVFVIPRWAALTLAVMLAFTAYIFGFVRGYDTSDHACRDGIEEGFRRFHEEAVK